MCADVIRLVLAEHELVTGEVVLEEVRRVLAQKIHLSETLAADILDFLENQTVQAKPKTTPSIRVRDEDDLWILASALAAKAEVLVTGGKGLLNIRDHVPDLLITDPRGFWNLAKKRPKK